MLVLLLVIMQFDYLLHNPIRYEYEEGDASMKTRFSALVSSDIKISY